MSRQRPEDHVPTLITGSAVRSASGLVGEAVRIDDGLVTAVGTADALRARGVEEAHFGEGVIIPVCATLTSTRLPTRP